MSLVSKGLQIFSLVGAVSSVPFIPSFTEENVTIPIAELTAGGGEDEVSEPTPAPLEVTEPEPSPAPVTVIHPEPKTPEAMQHAMEQMANEKGVTGTNGLGCFWMPGLSGTELFFCFEKGAQGTSPFLFHYSYRGGNSLEDKLQKVERVSKGTKAHLKQKGEKGIQGAARLLLGWTQKWPEQTPFDPSQHCQVSMQVEGDYEISCTNPASPEKTAWSRKISKSHIVDPQTKVKKTF